ncbi:MAG TPA: hypothetical protein V6C88_10810 [Chroococcidiopsis sp.]
MPFARRERGRSLGHLLRVVVAVIVGSSWFKFFLSVAGPAVGRVCSWVGWGRRWQPPGRSLNTGSPAGGLVVAL